MMEVMWTEPALSDLRSIRDYIARDSVYYAEKVLDEAFDKVDDLGRWPEMGRRVPEENDPAIRELIHYSYRIIYQIAENKIYILAVIHGRKQYATPEGASP